jgi:hypothetical protein
MKSIKNENSPVFICPPYTRLSYLYHNDIEAFQQFDNIDNILSSKSIFPVYNSIEMESYLDSSQVVYVDVNADFLYPKNNILSSLGSKYKLVDRKDFPHNLSVYVFNKTK